jgi:hypothetical protein
MKNKYIYALPMILVFTALNNAPPVNGNTALRSISYFPADNNITLVYKSSFGESTTNYFQEGEFTVSSSKSDNFKYRQVLLIKDDGVYVKETYQYLKVFLFIKKEGLFTYGKPLLRFPLPLSPGMTWEWEGNEYCDGDTTKVKVTGKAVGKEFVVTKAGRFEAIKIESIVEGSADAKNIVTEWYAAGVGLIKANIIIEGGGIMGLLRDLLGYGTIEFELEEIRKR